MSREDRKARRAARRARREERGRPVGKAFKKVWEFGKKVAPRPFGGAGVDVGDRIEKEVKKRR